MTDDARLLRDCVQRAGTFVALAKATGYRRETLARWRDNARTLTLKPHARLTLERYLAPPQRSN